MKSAPVNKPREEFVNCFYWKNIRREDAYVQGCWLVGRKQHENKFYVALVRPINVATPENVADSHKCRNASYKCRNGKCHNKNRI